MKKTFLFVMPGVVPIANIRVCHLLSSAFPDLTCEVLDCSRQLRSRPMVLLSICVSTAIEAGPGIFKSRGALRDAILRSVATERWIKKWVAERVSAANVAFTFQMQSLFDASVPDCPNFVFTDHTRLENLNYPASDQGSAPPQRRLDRETEIYANAKMVFVRSENIKKSLIEQYRINPHMVEVVYAGSNLQGERAHQPDTLDRDPYTILFVGLDWERKGGPELLVAFRLLRQTHPQARLVIAGAAPELPGDIDGIEVVGEVSIAALGELYQRAGIFCLPTRREPFGIVFLEAMEHGLPVVGTDIGAQVDFIRNGETGFRVPVRDPEALAAALRRLCDDPEAARAMGQRGERLVRERYNWKNVVTRMTATIRSVLTRQTEGTAAE